MLPALGKARDLVAGEDEAEHVSITLPVVGVFVAIATVMMFVLFFVLNRYVFYVFLLLFSIGSGSATATCLHAAFGAAFPASSRTAFSLQKPKMKASFRSLIAGALALALVLTWLLQRHAVWAWVPQNMLGIFFMILILQTISLPDLKVATVFLAALFCYDIFMVFLTPLFMPHGDSVMVKVARGGSANEVRHPRIVNTTASVVVFTT